MLIKCFMLIFLGTDNDNHVGRFVLHFIELYRFIKELSGYLLSMFMVYNVAYVKLLLLLEV